VSTDQYLRILERRAQAWALQVADLEDRLDQHTRVLESGVRGTVLDRDPLWRNLRDQLEEARDEYVRHRTAALKLRIHQVRP
jgi:hypothetical protein